MCVCVCVCICILYVCVYMYAVGLLLSAQFRGFEAEVCCTQFVWSAVGPLLSVPLLSAVFGTEVWCAQVLGMVGVWLCIYNIYVCMYVYICMCVCMYVYMYVYMYIYVYMCVCDSI